MTYRLADDRDDDRLELPEDGESGIFELVCEHGHRWPSGREEELGVAFWTDPYCRACGGLGSSLQEAQEAMLFPDDEEVDDDAV